MEIVPFYERKNFPKDFEEIIVFLMNKQFLKNFENVLEHFFEEKNSFFSK